MPHQPAVLAISGSARAASYNTRLLRLVLPALESEGVAVEEMDLGALSLPLMNEDLEAAEGTPAAALRLKKAIARADGLVIASPEYNGSITPLLKNAIDWASRPGASDEPKMVFSGKIGLVISASPGQLGGMRAQYHVRQILGNLGALVLPELISLPNAGQALTEDGNHLPSNLQDKIAKTAAKMARTLQQLIQ